MCLVELLCIVLVGIFKVGKFIFVNVFVGDDIVLIDVIEVIWIVIWFWYGLILWVIVNYCGG